MEILQSRTSGSKRTDLWKFPSLDFEEAKNIQSGISALYNNEVNGYLVKNFLTQDEVEHALKNIKLLDTSAKGDFSENAGYSNPKSFSMLADENGINNTLLEKYFSDIANYKSLEKSIFPFGFEERLFDFISKFENNTSVITPVIEWENESRQFTSSTVRVCFSECGGMKTHVGNMFRTIYPKFYSFLDTLMQIDGQISYFVMLSKPEKGGELVLYNALWKEYVMANSDYITKVNGEQVLIDSLDFQLIDPKPGDLILFNGGDIWHRINNLTGAIDRITVGGFFAKTTDGKKIYGWA